MNSQEGKERSAKEKNNTNEREKVTKKVEFRWKWIGDRNDMKTRQKES